MGKSKKQKVEDTTKAVATDSLQKTLVGQITKALPGILKGSLAESIQAYIDSEIEDVVGTVFCGLKEDCEFMDAIENAVRDKVIESINSIDSKDLQDHLKELIKEALNEFSFCDLSDDLADAFARTLKKTDIVISATPIPAKEKKK
jgi:hypothetical protein